MNWNEIFVPVIQALLVALVPYLGILVGKAIKAIIDSIKNPTVRALAYDAVYFAEDKFGPDTAKGKEKLADAVAFLVKKGHISQERAEVLVRSAYQNIFVQLPKEVKPA